MSSENKENKTSEYKASSAFRMTPKMSFFIGAGSALGVFFAVGFFVLLGMVLKKGDSESVNSNVASQRQPSAPSVASPTRPSQPSAGNIVIQPVTEEDYVRGNRDAQISVIEFSDLECPFCKRFHPTMQRVVEEYGGKVNWVYRHFPLTSIHPKAPKEAEAAECAGELGGNDGFWAYIDRLFEITPSNNGLDLSQLPQIAQDVGLNRQKFEECLNSGKYAQKVQDQYNQATAAGGRGTPYSVVVSGDRKIPVSGAVPFEQIKAVIDPLL